MKKILVVNVNWVGDVIFSSPIFKALKQAYPKATISCMAPLRVKEVLECVECLDEIIICDEGNVHRNIFDKIKLILELRKKKFDAAFLLHRSLTRALFIFFAGIPNRIGYDTKKRGAFLTHKVDWLEVNDVHRSDYYLNVIESFGLKVNERKTVLVPKDEVTQSVKTILKNNGVEDNDKLIIVNCGGNWDLKRWPKENFVELIEKLIGEYEQKNIKVIISGAPKDIVLVESIVEHLKEKPVILTGKTTLQQVVSLMSLAELLISADSGPLHIANSVNTDTIAIFGPTRPEITGPKGPGTVVVLQKDVECNRQPCYKLDCDDNICMKSVTVDDVFDIAVKMIRDKIK
ncbi:MAG: lipopolysaccharide heptosyltransferase II [Candidatus Omnitrophica bacterium]|nr:lipopolysaccharide heptosyltransferase II [Candidatus Omnitrophota bacterium]MBU1995905.1 lipopolysaccharide heptosyltransferase II [Candidatus Omnitrophota bacterium]MBU4333541.1 lipopolysaccharide heptosyltransferase II [Candidatus Omnitrophota bacterium]